MEKKFIEEFNKIFPFFLGKIALRKKKENSATKKIIFTSKLRAKEKIMLGKLHQLNVLNINL